MSAWQQALACFVFRFHLLFKTAHIIFREIIVGSSRRLGELRLVFKLYNLV
jgi:hypothetical protein